MRRPFIFRISSSATLVWVLTSILVFAVACSNTPEPTGDGTGEGDGETRTIEDGEEAILLTQCGPGGKITILGVQDGGKVAARLARLEAKFADDPEKAAKFAELEQKRQERQEERQEKNQDAVDRAIEKKGKAGGNSGGG